MEIRQQSRGLGFINADAAAPLPLTRSEWDRAGNADLPRARELLRRHVGLLAEFFSFEPDGLDTVITATIIEARGGSEVSLTMRLREVAPPKSGLPRREYPPPSALQVRTREDLERAGARAQGEGTKVGWRRQTARRHCGAIRFPVDRRFAYNACVSGVGIVLIRVESTARRRS